MRLLCRAALAAAFVSAALPSFAGVFAYVTNYRQELEKIDLTSPATALVANIGFTAEGLAMTSSGTLFATNSAGKLFNITGGIVTPFSNLGALSVGGMDSAGATLWGYDNASNRIFEYDPTPQTFTTWSPNLNIPFPVKALVIDPTGGFLAVVNPVFGTQKLLHISNTWTVSVVNANMGLADDLEAMDFLSDGNLYGAVLGDIRYQIDPLTGNVLNTVPQVIHRDWADMTAIPNRPVPEPASMAALGIGLVALIKRRRN